MHHAWLYMHWGRRALPPATESREIFVESLLERSMTQVVALYPIPRAELQESVRIDMEGSHAASSSRSRHALLLTGLMQQLRVLSIEVRHFFGCEAESEGDLRPIKRRPQVFA